MAVLMRSRDWSQTPLGAVNTWPQSLRTVLGILLASRHPIFLWWGPELVQFYNDASRPMLGTEKHPQAMGQRGRNCWGEVWPTIQPMIESVMERGEATQTEAGLLLLDRNGYLEEGYFDYAYSPIQDDDGGIGGIFCICNEVTERVLSERRLRTLCELITQTVAITSVQAVCQVVTETLATNPQDIPFALIYVVEAEGRQARLGGTVGIAAATAASPAVVDLTQPGRSWPLAQVAQTGEGVILEDLTQRFEALPKGMWDMAPAAAAVMPLAQAGHDTLAGFLVLGISPRRRFDDEYRGFFDLLASHLSKAISVEGTLKLAQVKREANALIQRSEERSRLAVRIAELGTWRYNFDLKGVELDARTGDILGQPEDTAMLPLDQVLAQVHPEDRSRVVSTVDAALDPASTGAWEIDCRLIWPNRTERWVAINGQVKFAGAGDCRRAVEFLGTALDITARKQADIAIGESEARFRTLADNMSQLAWMADASGWIFWYNSRWFEYTNTTLEQMQGWGWQQVHHPDHVERVTAHIRHCFATGEDWEDTFLLRGEDGTYRWFLSRAVPITDETGAIRCWFGTNTDISDLMEVEAALRLSEQRYRLLTSTLTAVVWVTDAEGAFVTPQPEWEMYTGQAWEQHQGMGWMEAIHPGDREAVYALWQRARGQRSLYKSEGRIWHAPSGEYHYFEAKAVALFNADGSVREWIGNITDVHARQQAEADLRESDARRRFMLDSAQIGEWDLDLTSEDYTAIRSLKHDQIFGYAELQPQWTYYRFLDHVHPDDRPAVADCFQHTLDTNTGWNFECRILRADQSPGWIWVRSSVFCDASGTPTRLLGMVIDVTERKQAEAQVVASNTRLRLLAEVADDLLLNEDPKTVLASLLEKVVRHLGLEVYFNYLLDPTGQRLHLNTWGGISDSVAEAARVLEIGQGICGYVVQQRQPIVVEQAFDSDDSLALSVRSIGVRAYASHPLIVGDRVLGTLGLGTRQRGYFTRDELELMQAVADQVAAALERSRLVAELEARAEALVQTNRIKDEFLAVLSHELRTPLNPILGWAGLLRSGNLDAAKTDRALETIERNAKLQVRLIEDLLDVSRILQGKLSLTMAPVNLAAVLESALETVQLAAAAKSIQIETTLEPALGLVLGDATRLQQVVWNLLSNAVKFTASGGRVNIRLGRAEDQAQIQVSDTGQGIAPEFLPYIFDYFRQADSATTRQFGGLGLGLAIVRHLIELHGGTVDVHSPGEGQGTTFTLNLPLMPPASQPRSALDQALTAKGLASLAGLRILVVDDDGDTRNLITFALEQHQVSVTAVASASQALQTLDQAQFDLLISDIGMPGMDGYMLMEQVRARPPAKGGDILAVALTAYVGQANQRQTQAAGFQRHIPKPVDLEALVKTIEVLAGSGDSPA